MSTNTKQDVWCVRVYEDRLKTVTFGRPYTKITQHIYCLRCADGPFLLKHAAVKPPWRDFSTLCYRSLPFFFLSYHRACGVRGNIKTVFPVVLCKGVCQTCNPQAFVCTSHQTKHTVIHTHFNTHTLSRSPFQNHLWFSSLPVCWPHRNSFLKGCLESSLITRIG